MNLIFFEDKTRENFLPFTFTRPLCDIRIGILTIREKWEKWFGVINSSTVAKDYLVEKYTLHAEQFNFVINGALIPDAKLVENIKGLKDDEALYKDEILLAANIPHVKLDDFVAGLYHPSAKRNYEHDLFRVNHLWDIFLLNGKAIEYDFELVTKGRKSKALSATNKVIGDPSKIFLEEGAKAECVIFNTDSGSVYIGVDSEVMEGSVIRGGFALCEHSQLKLATKIYGPTTIGPHSKMGGEVNNSVVFGYTNKAHDGFIGNSVLGEWCNLGADTNNSNLKNNYGEVKLWSYTENRMVGTGLQFCGLMMGDHSKCGINTMFNTGTVVGVSSNIFGAGFPPTHIPSFSWGGADGFEPYQFDKAMEVAARVYERRGLNLKESDKDILQKVSEIDSV